MKYEAGLIRTNEALYLQNRVNSCETMKIIESRFGPFDEKEIEFYRENLKNENGSFINNFQKQLIFNMFYKYFGDVESVYSIVPSTDYIKLMIAAKRILKLKDKLNKILSNNTKQDLGKIEIDTERDYYMDTNESLEYGIVDKIL